MGEVRRRIVVLLKGAPLLGRVVLSRTKKGQENSSNERKFVDWGNGKKVKKLKRSSKPGGSLRRTVSLQGRN
jgi:hypothetical protein